MFPFCKTLIILKNIPKINGMMAAASEQFRLPKQGTFLFQQNIWSCLNHRQGNCVIDCPPQRWNHCFVISLQNKYLNEFNTFTEHRSME